MIKITDEQKQRFADNDLLNLPASLIVGDFLKSLTIDQIKQLAEQHGFSVIEWVDFHADDESTWPKEEKLLLAPDPHGHLGQCTRIYECGSDWLKFHWCGSGRNLPYQKPFKWAYLPPKEKRSEKRLRTYS